MVSASHPAEAICTLIVPGWPNRPRIVGRRDGKDEITVVGTQRYPQEAWRLVVLRPGVLLVVGGSTIEQRKQAKLVPDEMAQLTVSVPPSLVGTLRVLNRRPED